MLSLVESIEKAQAGNNAQTTQKWLQLTTCWSELWYASSARVTLRDGPRVKFVAYSEQKISANWI